MPTGFRLPAQLFTALMLSFLVTGCALWPFGDDEEEVEKHEEITSSEQVLYRNSQRSLRSGNYEIAIRSLEALEAQYPFGRYAEQAQLELIYARHMQQNHEAARAAADRFIRLHPNHSNVDYAFYLKGIASFQKNTSLLDRLVTTDPAKRDMSAARESYADFAQLLARYPTSQYVPDAKQRMVYLRNLLARSELAIADFYLRRGAYMAANNRARYVVENYARAEATPDALAIMVECGWRLGLEESANDALRVLAENYPNYPAFDAQGNLVLEERVLNRDRSWTNLMTFGLLDRPEVPPPLEIRHPEGYTPPQRTSTPQQEPEEPEKKSWWRSIFSSTEQATVNPNA